MRRRGKPQTPGIDPEFAQLVGGLYYALEDNLERCARLTHVYQDGGVTAPQRHDEALQGAARIAYVQRVTFDAMAHVIDFRELPPGVLPIGVLSALARLAYALAALAEDGQPEPEQLLTPDEIRDLPHQYGIEDWLERCRASNPDRADR